MTVVADVTDTQIKSPSDMTVVHPVSVELVAVIAEESTGGADATIEDMGRIDPNADFWISNCTDPV